MKEIIIITGATKGIGLALTSLLLSKGKNILAVGQELKLLSQLQLLYPEQLIIVQANLATPMGRKRLIDSIHMNMKITHLVHNAGIITPTGDIAKLKEGDIDKIFEINAKAPLLITAALVERLNGARILNISSRSALEAFPELTAYNMTKASLHMLTMNLQKALLPYGAIATSVIPGEVDTPMQELLRSQPTTEFKMGCEFIKAAAQGKLIKPEVTAKFLAWLLLDSSNEKFSSQVCHDIYDKNHHHYWLQGGILPSPPGEESTKGLAFFEEPCIGAKL